MSSTPYLFADTTTEGLSCHYYYNGAIYGSFADLLTAASGTYANSTGKYVTNSSGLLARVAANTLPFDYSPTSIGTCLGLLLEGSSTNLLGYSNLTAAPWNAFSTMTVTANATTAPDGTSTASLLTMANSGSHEYQIIQTPPGVGIAVGTNTFSVYGKAGTGRYINLEIYAGGAAKNCAAVFDLGAANTAATQTYSTADITVVSTSQTLTAEGFYRLSITFDSTVTDSGGFVGLNPCAAATGNTFGADGGITANVANLTFYAWGAQYEALPFASSLIATTSSTATRVADSITMPVPTIAAGALYVKASTAYVAQTQRLIQIDDGTEANRATLNLKSSSTGEFSFVDSGASEADLATGATAPNTPEQIAAAFQSNDFAVVVNNGTPATASVGGVPSFNTLRLGADSAEGTNLYGHIAQFGVWNSRLSNSELGAEPDSYVTEIFSPVASIGCGSFSILGQDASFYILDDGRTELGCGAFNIVGSAVTTTTTQVTWGVISGPTNSWGGVP